MIGEKNNKQKRIGKKFSCELNELKNSLTKDAPKLYPDIWDSAIASGQLELLDSEQLTKLTNVYRKIKGTDYEGTRVRDAKDAFEETSSPDARKHYSIQSQAHEKRIEETKALIDEVFNKPC